MSVSPIGGPCRPGPGTHCRTCSLSSLCLPLALKAQAMEDFDAIIKRRAPLVRGEVLCRQGEPFAQIFAVRSGSFKQVVLDQDGEEQISHFHLPGELMGLESIEEGSHAGFIIALERSTACEIPFHQLDALAERMPELRNQLYRSMSRVMGDEHRLIRLLTCKSADERMASFLLDLARRFERYGYSPERFRLPMSPICHLESRGELECCVVWNAVSLNWWQGCTIRTNRECELYCDLSSSKQPKRGPVRSKMSDRLFKRFLRCRRIHLSHNLRALSLHLECFYCSRRLFRACWTTSYAVLSGHLQGFFCA